MKTALVTDYTNQTPPTYFGRKHSLSNNRKNEKIFIKCAQNRRRTSSICEENIMQSLNEKKGMLLELQITQTRHPKNKGADGRTNGWMGGWTEGWI